MKHNWKRSKRTKNDIGEHSWECATEEHVQSVIGSYTLHIHFYLPIVRQIVAVDGGVQTIVVITHSSVEADLLRKRQVGKAVDEETERFNGRRPGGRNRTGEQLS